MRRAGVACLLVALTAAGCTARAPSGGRETPPPSGAASPSSPDASPGSVALRVFVPAPGQQAATPPPDAMPKPQTLSFSRSTRSGDEIEEESLTLTIEPARATRAGMSQRQVWRAPEQTREITLVWRAREVLLARQRTTEDGGAVFDCPFEPPPRNLVLPLRVGASWADGTDCRGGASTYEGEVVRAERLTIGGRAVDTFVIRKAIASVQYPDLNSVQLQWHAPRLGVTVRIESTDRSGASEVRSVTELKELPEG